MACEFHHSHKLLARWQQERDKNALEDSENVPNGSDRGQGDLRPAASRARRVGGGLFPPSTSNSQNLHGKTRGREREELQTETKSLELEIARRTAAMEGLQEATTATQSGLHAVALAAVSVVSEADATRVALARELQRSLKAQAQLVNSLDEARQNAEASNREASVLAETQVDRASSLAATRLSQPALRARLAREVEMCDCLRKEVAMGALRGQELSRDTGERERVVKALQLERTILAGKAEARETLELLLSRSFEFRTRCLVRRALRGFARWRRAASSLTRQLPLIAGGRADVFQWRLQWRQAAGVIAWFMTHIKEAVIARRADLNLASNWRTRRFVCAWRGASQIARVLRRCSERCFRQWLSYVQLQMLVRECSVHYHGREHRRLLRCTFYSWRGFMEQLQLLHSRSVVLCARVRTRNLRRGLKQLSLVQGARSLLLRLSRGVIIRHRCWCRLTATCFAKWNVNVTAYVATKRPRLCLLTLFLRVWAKAVTAERRSVDGVMQAYDESLRRCSLKAGIRALHAFARQASATAELAALSAIRCCRTTLAAWRRSATLKGMAVRCSLQRALAIKSSVVSAWASWLQKKWYCAAAATKVHERCKLSASRRVLRTWLLAGARVEALRRVGIRTHALSNIGVSDAGKLQDLQRQHAEIRVDSADLAADMRSECATAARIHDELNQARTAEGVARNAHAMQQDMAETAMQTLAANSGQEVICVELERQMGETVNLETALQSAVVQASLRVSARVQDLSTTRETNTILEEQLEFVTSQYASALTTLDAELALLSSEKLHLVTETLRLQGLLQVPKA